MRNNQTKWGIIYEKIAMLTGDDERMIMIGLYVSIIIHYLFSIT